MTSALLTTGDTRSDEEKALSLELLGATDGVGVVRVSTVNNDITGLQLGNQLLNESIYSGTGLDEENDLSGGLQLLAQLLDGVSTLDVGA